jgi:Tol biopolymer transport system component
VGYSDDLARMVAFHRDSLGVPGDGEGLYIRDTATGVETEIPGTSNGGPPFGKGIPGSQGSNPGLGGELLAFNSDLRHLFFLADDDLTPDTPGIGVKYLYGWDGSSLTLVSKLPAAEGGAAIGGAIASSEGIADPDNAVSPDGSRVIWYSKLNSEGVAAQTRIFVTEDGETTEVSASERDEPDPNSKQDSLYAGASRDAKKVFFTSFEKLTSDSTATFGAGELYRYDSSQPEGERLLDLSVDPGNPQGAGVQGGVAAISDDGNRAYFVALGNLAEGAAAGRPNLYLWDYNGGDPTVTHVATVDSLEFDDDAALVIPARTGGPTPSATADGEHFVFSSRAQLTPYDNDGYAEIYVYDASADEIECASCSPTGEPPTGEAAFADYQFGLIGHQLRNISANGERVFFESPDPLLRRDSNGRVDVYMWRDGQLHLISSGEDAAASHFLDASASGNDVFFATREPLSTRDTDLQIDVYDARVDGIADTVSLPVPACEGDACHPAPVVPDDPTPASTTFSGAGNQRAETPKPRCRKGQRKVRRSGKARCIKQKKKQRGQKQPGSKGQQRGGK